MRSFLRIGILLVSAGLLAAGPGTAQNLITNGGFDGSAAGWSNPLRFTYSGLDALLRPGSGSGRFRLESSAAFSYDSSYQCVEVKAGRTYVLGGRAFVPSGQARTGSAGVQICWYALAGCDGPPLGCYGLPAQRAPGAWLAATRRWPAPAGARTAAVFAVGDKFEAGGTLDVHFDDISFGLCVDTPTALCLNGPRFLVEATFRTSATGPLGVAQALPLRPDSGLFWFFGPDNLELLVKVLNGCTVNGRYWVFLAAATDVEFTVTITDTETGAQKTYTNPPGHLSGAQADVNAFSGCT